MEEAPTGSFPNESVFFSFKSYETKKSGRLGRSQFLLSFFFGTVGSIQDFDFDHSHFRSAVIDSLGFVTS